MGLRERLGASRRAFLRRAAALPAVLAWTAAWLLWSDGLGRAALVCVLVALPLTWLAAEAFRASLRDETEPPVYPPPY